MVCIMFFKLILIKRCLYNQGYIEKDFFLLKSSKSEVVTFVKNFRKYLFQNTGVYIQTTLAKHEIK